MSNYKGVLVGESLSLDFCNTVDDRPGFLGSQMTINGDHLQSIDDFFTWAETAELLSKKDLRKILSESKSDQTLKNLFKDALLLRELLFTVFLTSIQKRKIKDSDLEKLNEFIHSLPPPKIITSENGLKLDWTPHSIKSLPLLLGRILQDAITILSSEKKERLKYCAAEDCGWLFIDTSKNNSRRWCDMADCGNRVKAERFYKKNSNNQKNRS